MASLSSRIFAYLTHTDLVHVTTFSRVDVGKINTPSKKNSAVDHCLSNYRINGRKGSTDISVLMEIMATENRAKK